MRRGAIVVATLIGGALAGHASASDCPPNDPSRNDCAAAARPAKNPLVPVVGAIVGTIVAVIIVNGREIGRRVLGGPAVPPGTDVPQVTLDVQTTGGRSTLAADGRDTLTVTARLSCSKPGVDLSALAGSIASAQTAEVGQIDVLLSAHGVSPLPES